MPSPSKPQLQVYNIAKKITNLPVTLYYCKGEDFVLKKAVVTESTEVSLLGYDEGPLEFTASPAGLNIKIPLIPFGELKYAWTFKLTYLA
jgi:hypothetical protein